MTEIIKANIEAAYGDSVQVGRTAESLNGELVFIGNTTPDGITEHIYFSAAEREGLDEMIEALIRARKEVFGTKP